MPPHWLLAFVPASLPRFVHVNEIPRGGERSVSCAGRTAAMVKGAPAAAALLRWRTHLGSAVASPVVTPLMLNLKAEKTSDVAPPVGLPSSHSDTFFILISPQRKYLSGKVNTEPQGFL